MIFGKKEKEAVRDERSAEERYLFHLKQFQLFYLELVIGGALVLAIAVVLAIYKSVLAGILTALAVGAVYVYFTTDELRKSLGVSCKNEEGAMIVTGFDAKGEEELYLPARLLWVAVETVADGAGEKEGNASLISIHLPKSLCRIEADAFSGCEALTTVLFEGSEEEWSKVVCEADLSALTLVFDVAYPMPLKEEKPKKKHKKKEAAQTPEQGETKE